MARDRRAWRGQDERLAGLASRYVAGLHFETVLVDEAGLHLYGDMDRGVRRLVYRRGVALLAAEFAFSGVAVVIDDTLETDEGRRAYTDRLKDVRLVHLLPPLDVALARNAALDNKPQGDAPLLDATARRLYSRMRAFHSTDAGWFVLDSTELGVTATVDARVERYDG
ncbi:MAG: hypothetical protein AUH85_09270 [Chloroflexi bacterium 13_1_40CM_4_68_4]|nr:MAG: hypothetical protein AUH85_09270 [Chloroflexi bacterium 13_1_40CM_4_68_4]